MDAHRRNLMVWLGKGILGLGACGAGLLVGQFFLPPRVRDLSKQLYLGPLGSLPAGTSRYLPGPNVYVFHDEQGLYALSGRCTHLGCSLLKHPEGFSCPCHGARFDHLGQPLSGPVTRPLAWFRIGLDPQGRLMLYLDQQVKPGARMRV